MYVITEMVRWCACLPSQERFYATALQVKLGSIPLWLLKRDKICCEHYYNQIELVLANMSRMTTLIKKNK